MYVKILGRFQQICEHNRANYLEDCLPVEEAIKKQIPQKPKAVRSHDSKGFIMGDCPVCGRTVDNNEHYCFTCGQRLDWEADK